MAQLPIELIRDIIENVDDGYTLTLLALVCKIFLFEADRVLYFEAPKNQRHIKFLDSIVREPRLAAFVRCYAMPYMVGTLKTSCWQLVRIALPMMINLKELSITASANELKVLPMHSLKFHVETLTWIPTDSPDFSQFSKWITSQNAVKQLRWIHKGPVDVPPNSFPNVISLEGNSHVVKALLPGRTIQRLHWVTELGPNEFDVSDEMAAGLQRLESLTFENQSNAIDYLSISQHLSSLTFLEFIGYHDQPDVYAIPIPATLRTLVFSFGLACKDNALYTPNRSDTVADLFRRGRDLHRVDIAQNRATKHGGFYERWEYGKCLSTLIPSDIVHEISPVSPKSLRQ